MTDFTYYPVVIPTLCRYEHFKNLIESLTKCNNADKTEVIIGLDYPPSEKYIDGWKKIKDYLPKITGFKKITVIESEKNVGSVENTKLIRNEAYKTYDAHIFSEDDNIVAPAFLDYMNWALNTYKNNNSVLIVSGYVNPYWKIDSKSNVLIHNRYFSAWGCGFWKNKIPLFENKITKDFFINCLKRKNIINKLLKSPRNLISFQSVLFEDNVYPMDVTRSLFCYIEDKYFLMPKQSLVRNCGWDGSGEHCKDKMLTEMFNNQAISPDLINSFTAEKLSEKEIRKLEKLQKKYTKNFHKEFITSIIKLILLKYIGMEKYKKLIKIIKIGIK